MEFTIMGDFLVDVLTYKANISWDFLVIS